MVSPATSQSALAPTVKGAEPQKPSPADRAAVNGNVPWYGWPNWFTQKSSRSRTQAPPRFRPTESAVTCAQGAAPT